VRRPPGGEPDDDADHGGHVVSREQPVTIRRYPATPKQTPAGRSVRPCEFAWSLRQMNGRIAFIELTQRPRSRSAMWRTSPSRVRSLGGHVINHNGPRSSTRGLTTVRRERRFVFNQSVEQGADVVDDHLSRVFAALADPTRRDIVARLAVGDATVGELAEPYDVSVQAVSKHIKVLTDVGLVTQRKDAQRRPCHLEADVFDLMTKWIERYRQQAQERYERLDAVVAEMRADEQPTHPHYWQQGAAS
jgi:DNA-binding transcriptional ArsR family regulator